MVCKIPDLIMDYFFAESENYKDLKVIMHFLLIACKYKFSRSIHSGPRPKGGYFYIEKIKFDHSLSTIKLIQAKEFKF